MTNKYSSGRSEGENPKKEEARRELAVNLLKYASGILTLTIFGTLFLIWSNKLEADRAITLILAVSGIFSGLLGSATAYYFSSNI